MNYNLNKTKEKEYNGGNTSQKADAGWFLSFNNVNICEPRNVGIRWFFKAPDNCTNTNYFNVK